MLLNFREYSTQGLPVLVLHGLFGSLSNWGWHCKQLSSQFAVIGIDLRNHGESPHDPEMNYPAMARDIADLMAHLGLDQAAIIGHSMGGKVAMELALSQPDLVERLLVVDIAPVAYEDSDDGHLRVLAGMRALDLPTLRSRGEAERQLAEYIEDSATRQFVLTNIVRAEQGGYRWRLNLDAIENNYPRLRERPAAVGPYNGPTMFVRGDMSRYVQKKHEAEILALFPQAGVKSIMETGHWLHADKPQVFQKIASDFLARESVGTAA